MNCKKIAELLRAFADTCYGSDHPDIEMEGYRLLTNIADELDPPDTKPEPAPEPAFKVGDWVEIRHKYIGGHIHHGRVVSLRLTSPVITIQGEGDWVLCDHNDYIFRKIKPSEVKVKVTLEGTVSQDRILEGASCFELHTNRSSYIINLGEIDEQGFVDVLLMAQEEEEK